MPFARIPETGQLQLPQGPNWGQFAAQAINLRANRPIIDYAGAVEKAVGQISNILTYNSPQEKMKRQLQMVQSQAMYQNYQNYMAHPEKFKMGANGVPVPVDPLTTLAQAVHLKNAVTSGKNDELRNLILNQKLHPAVQGTDASYQEALKLANQNPVPVPGPSVQPEGDTSTDFVLQPDQEERPPVSLSNDDNATLWGGGQ